MTAIRRRDPGARRLERKTASRAALPGLSAPWLAALLLAFGMALPAGALAQAEDPQTPPPTERMPMAAFDPDGIHEASLSYTALGIAGAAADGVQARMGAIFDGVSREGLSSGLASSLSTSERLGQGDGSGINLWAQGFQKSLEVEEGDYPLDGDVTGGMVGLDVPGIKPGLIFGIGISHASSDLEFRDVREASGTEARVVRDGVHKTDLRGLHPYFGWQVSEDGNVWGVLGIAKGELEILQDDGERHEEDFELKIANFGGYNRFRERSTEGGGKISLAFTGESLYAEMRAEGPGALKLGSGRARFGFEIGYDRELGTGNLLGSTLTMNMRSDYGDLEDGFGMELGGGIDFAMPSLDLRFDLQARTLLAHQSDVQEWGLSGGVVWNSGLRGGAQRLSLGADFAPAAAPHQPAFMHAPGAPRHPQTYLRYQSAF